jgi:hypothetical protein
VTAGEVKYLLSPPRRCESETSEHLIHRERFSFLLSAIHRYVSIEKGFSLSSSLSC